MDSLVADLYTTMSKQDQLGKPYDRIRTDRRWSPPLKDLTPVLLCLHTALAEWATRIAGVSPTLPTQLLAAALLERVEWIAKSPDAGQLVSGVTDAVRRARRAIDRPHDSRVFLGPCGALTMAGVCTEELYGRAWLHIARCNHCGAEHRVKERQDLLRYQAAEYLATAVEISRFLRSTGMDVTAARLRGMAHRKRFLQRGTNQAGYPQYLIREVVEALVNRYKRKAS